MVSSLPTDTKNPGTYSTPVNKAKPPITPSGKPSTSGIVAVVANAIKIDEDYTPKEKTTPTPTPTPKSKKVVVIPPKATAAPRLTTTLQEVLEKNMSAELKQELKNFESKSDDELIELFTNSLLGHNKQESELIELKRMYDALQIKANGYEKQIAEMAEKSDQMEKTIEKITKSVASGSNKIAQLYKSSGETNEISNFILDMVELFKSMRKGVNLSDEVYVEEEINTICIPSVDHSDMIKETETPSLENDPLQKLLKAMTLQKTDALTLMNSLDEELVRSGGKATAAFFTSLSVILKTLYIDTANLKNNKKELNRTLASLQEEILSMEISPDLEKQLPSFQKIHPSITVADSKKNLEKHLQKQKQITDNLFNLVINYTQSHMMYLTIIQKISVVIACEKMENEEISKIENISALLGTLGLDFKAIKIPEIHYKVLNELFKLIKTEVSDCNAKFRSFRRGYMEINTPNIEQLKQTFKKEKLEFSWIELKWSFIAPYLNHMMSRMKKDVEESKSLAKIEEPQLNKFAKVKKSNVEEEKAAVAFFEAGCAENEAISILLDKDYETFERDIKFTKNELKRLIDTIEVRNGSFLSETYYKAKKSANGWNYFSSPSEDELAIEKMFPNLSSRNPKLED